MIDGMISTVGTVVESVRALRDAGTRPELFVTVTRALMTGEACTRFAREGVPCVFHTDAETVNPRREP